ncbi:MAG: pseudouridine synthase [Planctomycetota bacterium]
MPRSSPSNKTIDRLLSRAGVCSREQARTAIAEGRVQVNGKVLRDPNAWVDLVTDKVLFDGEPLRTRKRSVWMLHKPVGYVTTRHDERGRPTVCELMPNNLDWLAPVGRLDLETSGLLLFTNDGDLARAILEPASKLPKTYEALCSGQLHDAQIAALRNGVELDDGKTLPAHAEVISREQYSCRIRLIIHEGRNRQVRRMIRAVRSGVMELHRSRIGPLALGDLPSGEARALSADELTVLRAALADALAKFTSPRKGPDRAR